MLGTLFSEDISRLFCYRYEYIFYLFVIIRSQFSSFLLHLLISFSCVFVFIIISPLFSPLPFSVHPCTGRLSEG
jgi:hypothetical protein